MGTFFADYVAMVTPIRKKSNSTPFPAEPHVLMYIFCGWRKWCGTSYAPNFVEHVCPPVSQSVSHKYERL